MSEGSASPDGVASSPPGSSPVFIQNSSSPAPGERGRSLHGGRVRSQPSSPHSSLGSSPVRTPLAHANPLRSSSPVFVPSSSPRREPGSRQDGRTPRSQRNQRQGDSSPLAYPSSSGLMTSSSVASDLGVERRSRNRNAGRRGDVPSDSRFSLSGGVTSDLGSEPVRVIWGTNVSIQETMETFRRFLTGFKVKYRTALDTGVPSDPGEGEATIYLDILEDMRQLGTTNLNLDARNLLAYPPSHRLYYQLINYPQEVVPIMDQTIKDTLVAMVSADAGATPRELDVIEQRAYRVRPFGLDAKHGLRDLNPSDIDKLVSIKGLVLRSTPVIPDMTEAFFKCAVCNHTVVVEIDRGTITEPTRCPRPVCNQVNSMRLVHNRSRFSDKQVIRLQETPDVIPDGQTPHSVSLCVYDELVDFCRAGDRVQVTGIFRSVPVRANPIQRALKNLYKTYVDVVHVQKLDKKRMGVDTSSIQNLEEQIQTQQAESQSTQDSEARALSEDEINRIRETSKREDVFELLSRSLAPSVYEQEDVKKGILLQLFGGTNKKFEKGGSPRYRGDINILLCGDPSTSKSQILQYVHRIAPRGMYTSGKGSSAVGLTAYVTKDADTKQIVLESGALVLSDGGVCCIDEFDKMSEATRSVLHEVMEQQTVSIAKAGIITTLNARTSILASANPIKSQYDPTLPVPQNIDLPPTLLSRFDLVYLMIDKVDVQSDRRLARHLASMYLEDKPTTGTEEEVVSTDFLTSYISYAKQHVHPEITQPAREELVKAYVAMRKLGEDARTAEKRITATTRQLESMIRLSEAHAKIRLSEKVEVEDVLEAVRLIRSAIKEYAMDPATGTIDMDLVQTGQSKAQRNQNEVFKQQAVTVLEANPEGLRFDSLVRRVADMNVDRVDSQDVSASIRALSQEGVIVFQGVPRKLVRLA